MSNLQVVGGKEFDLPIDRDNYWSQRMNHDLYRLTVAMAGGMFRDAKSAIDVGSYISGLLVELDWIERRVATDISDWVAPNWQHVRGVDFIAGDAFEIEFDSKFDLVISNQTIEHLNDPHGFVEKLLSIGRGLIISTTYETPFGLIDGHVQDPISLEKFKSWFPVPLDAWTVCYHPGRAIKHVIGVIKHSHPNYTP